MIKILALPMYGIGDVLMTTPALRNLKEQLDAEITYLHMFKTTRDVLMNNPFVDHNIYFPFLEATRVSGFRFLMTFRKKFDCSINFYPSNRKDYNLAALIAGSPVRIGHRYALNDLSALNFLKNRTVQEDDNLHNVEENLKLIDFLGVRNARPYPLEIHFTDKEKLFADQWLREKRIGTTMLIGIHPGTSAFKNHDRRRWPESSFAKLIDALASELKDCCFLLVGGPEEKPLRDKVISMAHNKGRIFSVGSVSVRQSASLMERCGLFISNDSGPMHMAAAVGVATVGIFGPTNPVWVRPWGVKYRVVRSGLLCSPCFRYSPTPLTCISNLDYTCLRGISVNEVFSACVELLREK